jgi:hypothetical protein
MIFARIQVGNFFYDVPLAQNYDTAQERETIEEMATRIPGTFIKLDGHAARIKNYDAIEIVDDGQPEVPEIPTEEIDPNTPYYLLCHKTKYLGNDLSFSGIEYFKGGRVVVVVGAVNHKPPEDMLTSDVVEALLDERYRNIPNVHILCPGAYLAVQDARDYAEDYLEALEHATPYTAKAKTAKHFSGWGLDPK